MKNRHICLLDSNSLKDKIKSEIVKMQPEEKKAAQNELKKCNLPTAFNKVDDVQVLKQILSIVRSNGK